MNVEDEMINIHKINVDDEISEIDEINEDDEMNEDDEKNEDDEMQEDEVISDIGEASEVDENKSPIIVVNSAHPLCRWEQIRLSIIQERSMNGRE